MEMEKGETGAVVAGLVAAFPMTRVTLVLTLAPVDWNGLVKVKR